jgi:tetratricopeptide (TPR) repeat protein
MGKWLESAGRLRAVLFIIAIIGQIILCVVYPPSFLSSKVLIAPFPFLIFLTLSEIIFKAIILVECVRIIAYRSTSKWNWKTHFILVFVIIIIVSGLRLFSYRHSSMIYLRHAYSLIDKEDYAAAMTSLNIALKYDSKNYVAHAERAYVYLQSDNFQAALADYNASIKINPQSARAYSGRGFVYRKMNNYQAAMDDYNSAIRLDPKYANAYAGRGHVFYHMNEYQNALRDWNKAIEIDSSMSGKLEKWIKAVKKMNNNSLSQE